MIVYNVTVKAEHSISEEWIQWMKEIHVPELMETGCFTGYKLFRLLEQDESDGITFCAQYFCENETAYRRYIAEFAPAMREKGLQRFGNKFIAFRTLMQEM